MYRSYGCCGSRWCFAADRKGFDGMLFAALGWSDFDGAAEQLCEYFPSSGSGQVNVEFHVGG